MFAFLSDRRGEAALLEAAVILPLVFFMMVSLVGLSLYLCDAALTETLAEKYAAIAAQETKLPGAANAILQRELNPQDEWNQNTVAFVEQEPRNTQLFPSKPDYVILRSALRAEAEKSSFLTWETVDCTVTLESGVFSDTVKVTVRRSAKAGNLFSGLFPTCEATARARVSDCTETVRNTDLILDVIDDVSKRSSEVANLGERIAEIVTKKEK